MTRLDRHGGTCRLLSTSTIMPRSIRVSIIFLLTTVSSAHVARKKQRKERPSVRSSIHDVSLADRWKELQHENNETFRDDGFLLYLQQHESRKEQAIAKAKSSAQRSERLFLWRSILWSTIVMGIATYLVGNHADLLLSFWNDLKYTTGAAVAVNLAGTLYHQITIMTTTRTPSVSNHHQHNPWWLVLASILHPNTFTYVWQMILPTTARTIRKMLVSELWNRLFSRFFAIVGTLVLTTIRDTDDETTVSLVTWVEQDRSFVAMALKRGTRRLFQSVIQRHLHQAIVSIWEFSIDAIQAAVQPMMMMRQ